MCSFTRRLILVRPPRKGQKRPREKTKGGGSGGQRPPDISPGNLLTPPITSSHYIFPLPSSKSTRHVTILQDVPCFTVVPPRCTGFRIARTRHAAPPWLMTNCCGPAAAVRAACQCAPAESCRGYLQSAAEGSNCVRPAHGRCPWQPCRQVLCKMAPNCDEWRRAIPESRRC